MRYEDLRSAQVRVRARVRARARVRVRARPRVRVRDDMRYEDLRSAQGGSAREAQRLIGVLGMHADL